MVSCGDFFLSWEIAFHERKTLRGHRTAAENPAKQDTLNKKTRDMYFRNLFLPLSGFSATDISGTVDTARGV